MNLISLALAAGAAALLIRRKARAGQNLRFEPVMIAIDQAKTKQSAYTQIYYRVVLNAINTETAPIRIQNATLNATYQGKPVGTLTATTGATIPANSRAQLSFIGNIPTLGILSQLTEILQNGFKHPLKITGFIVTDLGRVPIDFEQKINVKIPGINGLKKKLDL